MKIKPKHFTYIYEPKFDCSQRVDKFPMFNACFLNFSQSIMHIEIY